MNMKDSLKKAVRKAVDAAGSEAELARRLDIAYQSVQQWQRIPSDRIVAVEKATGIPRQQLRPDLYAERVS